MSRRLLARLDAEETWRRRLRPDLPAGPLPGAVLDRISAFGTLLRVYARSDDDVLVLPRAIERRRLTGLLPRPRISAAAPPDRDPAGDRGDPGGASDEVLAWAVTGGRAGRIAARVNHRGFAFALQRRLGSTLPGASWIGTESEIGPAIAAARDGAGTGWVAKAPLSTAGRDRVIGQSGCGTSEGESEHRRLQALLRRHGACVVEPWVDRIDDVGILLEITDDGADVLGVHRQLVDRHGRFAGIELGEAGAPALGAADRAQLETTAEQVGATLHRVGYRGAAGIDAWTWRRAGGGHRLHPLGEINARYSFGRIARDLAQRLGRPDLTLRLGSAQDLPPDADILLRPAAGGSDESAAWIS